MNIVHHDYHVLNWVSISLQDVDKTWDLLPTLLLFSGPRSVFLGSIGSIRSPWTILPSHLQLPAITIAMWSPSTWLSRIIWGFPIIGGTPSYHPFIDGGTPIHGYKWGLSFHKWGYPIYRWMFPKLNHLNHPAVGVPPLMESRLRLVAMETDHSLLSQHRDFNRGQVAGRGCQGLALCMVWLCHCQNWRMLKLWLETGCHFIHIYFILFPMMGNL